MSHLLVTHLKNVLSRHESQFNQHDSELDTRVGISEVKLCPTSGQLDDKKEEEGR